MSGNNKILITGGTGYIGSDLVKILSKSNKVLLVVRNIEKAKELFSNAVEYIIFKDLNNFTTSIEKFSPNIVIHLAAYSTSSDELEDIERLIESNIIFTSNLLIALDKCNLDLFINTGSFSEYHSNDILPSPTYFYSATKTSARYMIEYYAKKNKFKFINAVLFTVYGKKGKHKKIIDYAMESLDSKNSIKMSDGKQELDFIHIDDVVAFYVNIILHYKNIRNSRIDYDVGTGYCISIRELVIILEKITKVKANILWGAYESRNVDTIKACAKIEILKEDLNYEAKILLIKGLEQYVNKDK